MGRGGGTGHFSDLVWVYTEPDDMNDRLLRRMYDFVASKWRGTSYAQQTPFLLTIRSGTEAVNVIRTLASHTSNRSPDDLLIVLVESLQGVTASRALQERQSLLRILKDVSDPLGPEAYALTTTIAALTIHIDNVGRAEGSAWNKIWRGVEETTSRLVAYARRHMTHFQPIVD